MKRNISRGEKKLVAASLLAFAIVGGGYVWRTYLNREPDLSIPPYPTLPNPNGFDLYVQAAQSITPANPAVDEINDRNPPTDPKVRAQQYSLARKEAWLRQNQAAFVLFQKALKTPTLHPLDRDPQKHFNGVYRPLRELARSFRIKARTEEMRGDWNRAVHSRIDAVQMGNDISRGGQLIAGLLGIAVQSIGRSEQWALTDKLNAAECRAAVARLEKIYTQRIRLDAVLTETKYAGQIQLVDSMKPGDWRMSFWRIMAYDGTPFQKRAKVFFMSERAIVKNYIKNMDVVIKNGQSPYSATKKSLPESDPINDMLMPVFERSSFNFARNDAGNALWLVNLAMRAYKSENGAYPAQLKELVPRYLKQIPQDPFGRGEPLRHQKRGNTYLLYSIGPDGIDNGGKPVLHRENATILSLRGLPLVLPDSRGDYVAGRNR